MGLVSIAIGPNSASEIGAVGKPFSYHEPRARIAALLRRTSRRLGSGKLLVGPLEVDPIARQVRLRGDPIELSAKKFLARQGARGRTHAGVHAR